MNNITIASLLRGLPKLIGDRPDPRWRRASLTLRGSDGMSREDFFGMTFAERVDLAHGRIVTRAPWQPLLRLDIEKKHGDGTRPICWATVIDTALIYALTDALVPHAEAVLTDVCIAYRPRQAIDRSIRGAIQEMRRRELYCACVVDIKSFYDSIPWKRLDAAIDRLPADGDVKTLLKELVRVRVRRLDDSFVERRRGIPQGLPISPVLANLVLADFDQKVQQKLARLGASVRRYADDILIAAPNLAALERARGIVWDQLRWEGLEAKRGTGRCVDLRADGAEVSWLGISLSTVPADGRRALVVGVSQETIDEKAGELLEELDSGLITARELDERLASLRTFYRAVLSEKTTEDSIRSIRERIQPTQGKTPMQAIREHMMRLEQDRNKEVKDKKIEEVIHRPHPVKRNNTLPGERVLDEGDRDRGLLPLHAEKGEFGFTTSGCSAPYSPRAVSGHGARRERALDGALGGRTAGAAPVTRGSPQDDDLWISQLSPLGGLRPDTPVGRDGEPASGSLPARQSETERVVVRAEAAGPRAVRLEVRGSRGWSEQMAVPDSCSTAEAVLAGFERALQRLLSEGLDDIALVTTEPTIAGYVGRGWRVGSVRVLHRLRALEFSSRGVRVVFATSPIVSAV